MLDFTPPSSVERVALRINPCKTCQPVGAMYAALGVHGCMPLSHGSQGCASYHRTVLSRHFKEPAIAVSSSFTEGASVFGGGSNIKTGVKNVFDIYKPDIIAVHTTCLSETIGDDVRSFIQEMTVPDGKHVVHANTPSYVGSHVTGYYNMMCGFINYLSASTGQSNGRVAVFPGWMNPGDLRELRSLLESLSLDFVMFPDQSGVMDSPLLGHYDMYPDGGTTIPEIVSLGDCRTALGLGDVISTEPCRALERKCKVPHRVLPYPIGVENTDDFVMEAASLSGIGSIPPCVERERGQLIDIMVDSHQNYAGKTAAVFGDPDTVLGLMSFVLELGMTPIYSVTGTPSEKFEAEAEKLLKKHGAEGCRAKSNADLFELHQWIKRERVDVLIGTTYGKQIAKAEDIPFVRAGFPVLDRYVHSYMPIVGYKGAMRLVEMIANALMEYRDRTCADEDLEIVM
ncbi:MAG: nitrogenase molybdenum-iron protein subunit beta [Candidatus Methanoplasma sp.]|nr:nitrogenase molybdenum-iron protein subunit beta [Candidatus Methanoplasma sp.]